MIGMTLNYFALILVVIVPACVIAGMAAVLIHDHIHKKRRGKRNYCPINNWWEYQAK